jgi:5-methylcytosine-specific restriction endonuclease McrA
MGVDASPRVHPVSGGSDHIVPLAQGGTHEPANVQCAHFLCNSIKSDSMQTTQQLMLFG